MSPSPHGAVGNSRNFCFIFLCVTLWILLCGSLCNNKIKTYIVSTEEAQRVPQRTYSTDVMNPLGILMFLLKKV